MTDLADPPPLRHVAVYRTVRGLALSGSRAQPATGLRGANSAPVAPPLRVSAVLRVRPAAELAATVVPVVPVVPEADEAAGLYDVRRYSEPND
jgi:hypothetical protein